MPSSREGLLRRVETEAKAFANSDSSTNQLRLGRVLGLLEAGVIAGHWRKRDSEAASELIRHRYRISKLRDVLLRGDAITLWTVTDIAEFLGVSVEQFLVANEVMRRPERSRAALDGVTTLPSVGATSHPGAPRELRVS